MRVYISGVFDLFHYGHMKLLNKCREQYPNDTLIVGVHNDTDSTNYKRKPVLTHSERVKTIRESKLSDEVLENAPLQETEQFYKLNKIDIIVHSHSLEDDEFYITNFYKYASDNGMFRRLNYTNTISTTDLINRIKCKD